MAENILSSETKVQGAVDLIVSVAVASRERNFSFQHKKPESFDEIDVGGRIFKIPTTAGSCFWAIIKVGYELYDKSIYHETLTSKVAALMEDRDEAHWQRYCQKSKTTVSKSIGGHRQRSYQPIKSWQERIINNAKTLTRLGGKSPYGLRLYERGHVFRDEWDDAGRPYFILRTSLDCLSGKEKKEADAEIKKQ